MIGMLGAGASISTVEGFMILENCLQETGTVKDLQKPGWPRVTTPIEGVLFEKKLEESF